MKKRILITEDDPGMQDVFKLIFERAGYLVTIFSNGDPIYKDEYEYPDIYLLDRFLSGHDGLLICRHLKAQEATKSIPVVMISATPGIGVLAKEAGADDFLEKPFKTRELLDLIGGYTNKVPAD